MNDRKRRWAKVSTISSLMLIIVFLYSYWQVAETYGANIDPEQNSLVKLNGGESKDFSVDQEINMFVAIRLSDGNEQQPDLVLLDSSGSEVSGKSPSWWQEERPTSGNTEIRYNAVRVFENLESGTYTLHNQNESNQLWLVDDLEGLGDNLWTYSTAISCCLAIPLGLIGIILAIMVWSDKRKSPDQFVIIQDGSVIIGDNTKIELEMSEENPSETDSVPEPFASEADSIPEPFASEADTMSNETLEEQETNWKSWDEG